jgi:hypothetical protein
VPRVQQIPPPPTPPDNIVTDQDRQTAVAYEQWLAGQQQSLAHQLSNLETQVSRFRKAKKVGYQKYLSSMIDKFQVSKFKFLYCCSDLI